MSDDIDAMSKAEFILHVIGVATTDQPFSAPRYFDTFQKMHSEMSVKNVVDLLTVLRQAEKENTFNTQQVTDLKQKIENFVVECETKQFKINSTLIKVVKPLIRTKNISGFIEYIKDTNPGILTLLLQEEWKVELRPLINQFNDAQLNICLSHLQQKFLETQSPACLQFVAFLQSAYYL
ncbi:hypothetical protein IT409_00810 [Candidatus Falkowbacteria bacterium]|nr:hypothetical protein [Candidatus Falkowbacteria bacterium]